jgi:peptide/nickel transport system permease protein
VLAYLLRRVLWAILLLVVMTFVTYVIFFQIPSDPARFIVRNQAPTDQQLEVARHQLGLDDPLVVQYGHFLWRAAHLDLGVSYQSFGRSPVPVTHLLREAAPVTASLILGGAILWLLLSIPLGILSALRPGSLLDRGILLFVLIGISAHPVSIGLFLRQFVGYKWQLVPIDGYCPLVANGGECSGVAGWLEHLLLPWLTFALLFAALYTRMVRTNVLYGLEEGWVRTARGKGASEVRVLRSHVLRSSLLPVVTMLGMDIGVAFGGAIFVERVFGLPGLGNLATSAVSGSVGFDLPLIVGVVLCVTTAVIVFNLIVDVLSATLDPRVRPG